ncbi:unnamed protein product [Rotaria sp. Silwood1]|nr:unnamed protein product [Rotaria sp. Silwood1]CAF1391698.1 unnamed protein product [Rotaria sp. Silwood1]CAF3561441.1 unnamed protein product [Rotaria sp. Silwood1]CAF3630664.1 unnamed protein product [Rotaria sp. Silwood1]CAF3630736.1 unnamed protein product [Rotaria sp. Silwood1]
MTDVTQPLPSRYTRSRTATAKVKVINDLAASTVTTITPMVKRAHDISLVTLAQDFAYRVSKRQENYQKFSASLLKNKSLLVPTRLALKRQRAAFKGPSLQYEPIRSEKFQIELGSLNDERGQSNRIDTRQTTTPEDDNRIKSTSNQTSSLREGTPHTIPTDISLMYREKPLYLHPITGHFIVQYVEDNGSPSPCSYVLPRKSCREKNAPAYTFGTRCLVEKKGGSRTAWQKQWFANSDPFTTKVDFNRECAWPTPFHYYAQPTIGLQSTKPTFPAWSIATRLQNSPPLILDNNPAPDTYDTTTAFRKLTAKSTPITLKSRIGGTKISTNQSIDITPGPGAHDESKFLSNRRSSPKHSFGKRIPSSLCQDPYVNVIPSIRT